jgi:hypothetical protein
MIAGFKEDEDRAVDRAYVHSGEVRCIYASLRKQLLSLGSLETLLMFVPFCFHYFARASKDNL